MTDYMTAIAAVKAAAVAAVPGVPVVQTHAEAVQIVEGIVQSYVVMTFGGPIKYGKDKGIVQSSRNPNLMWVTFQCVAAMPTTAERIKQNLFNALEDFYPPNAGRMTPEGGFATDTSSDTTKPVRYTSATRFTFVHNLATG